MLSTTTLAFRGTLNIHESWLHNQVYLPVYPKSFGHLCVEKTVPCPLLKHIDYVPQHLLVLHGYYSMEVVMLDASEVLDSMQQIQHVILQQFNYVYY